MSINIILISHTYTYMANIDFKHNLLIRKRQIISEFFVVVVFIISIVQQVNDKLSKKNKENSLNIKILLL